jgi:transposase-like protein
MAECFGAPLKTTRKSYTREEKLKTVGYYKENNLYKTCKQFNLNSKTVLRWVKDEPKIKKSKSGCR